MKENMASATGKTPSGDRAVGTGGSASAPAPKKKPLWRRIAGALVSLALIVLIFVGVIPQFASYQDAWTAIQAMSLGWWLAILIAAVVNQVSFVWPYQAVLKHLRFWHGFMETQTSTAVSNTGARGRGGGHRGHIPDVRQLRVLERGDQHRGGDDRHLEPGVQVRPADTRTTSSG